MSAHRGIMVAHGWKSWAEIRTLIGDRPGAWGDLDGFHLGEAVADQVVPPAYSHLWAWGRDSWFRVRLAGGKGLVLELKLSSEAESALEVEEAVASTWGVDEERIPDAARLGGHTVRVLLVRTSPRVEFVEVEHSDPGDGLIAVAASTVRP